MPCYFQFGIDNQSHSSGSSGDTTTQHDDELRASGTFGVSHTDGGEYSYDDSVGSGAGTGAGSFATSVSFTISYYRHQLDSYAGPDSGNSSSSTITGAGRYNYSDSGTYIGSFTMGSFSSSRNDTSAIVEEQATSQTETSASGYTWTTTVTTTTTTQMTMVATESGQYSGDDVDGHYFNQVAWNSQTVTVTCTDGQCSSDQSGSNGTTTGSGTLGVKPLPNIATDQQVTMQLGDIIAWYPTHYGSADGPKKPKGHAATMQEEARSGTPGANQVPQPTPPSAPISAAAVDEIIDDFPDEPPEILRTSIGLAPQLATQIMILAAGSVPGGDSLVDRWKADGVDVRDLPLLLRLAIERGYPIKYLGDGHYLILRPDGSAATVCGPVLLSEKLAEAALRQQRDRLAAQGAETIGKSVDFTLTFAPLPTPFGKGRWLKALAGKIRGLISPIASKMQKWVAPAARKGTDLLVRAGKAAAESVGRGFRWVGRKCGWVPIPKGQIHHPISTRIARALNSHPTLKGHFEPRDPRFTTQALDEAAHRGYQRWHRDLDDEVVRWINDPANSRATPQQFLDWLRQRYSQPDLSARFPNGF